MAATEGRRALIVGLGISGMATALRLHQIGWTPVIVERAPARRTGGYFVIVFGSGRAAAERLGVTRFLSDRRPAGVTYDCDRAGNRRVSMSFADLPGEPWTVLRGDVEDAAFRSLPETVETRYSTTPMKIEQLEHGVAVTLSNAADSTVTTEEFDLVVGADGLRSTVRRLAFGPDEKYLHRLDHMIATFELPSKLSDLAVEDGAWLIEPGRSLIIYPLRDRFHTALFSYRTRDVDAEFTEPPAARLRKVYGQQPPGRMLGEVMAAFEDAQDYLFDSAEQVRMDSWHSGRVVLVGDAAWCESMYSGLGASSALAGPDLLGTMIERHPADLTRALTEWEGTLRPVISAYQEFGLKNRFFFTPDNRAELLLRRTLTAVLRISIAKSLLARLTRGSKTAQLKDRPIVAR